MSAVPVAPQALQDPDVESIEPPSIDRELKSGRILQQACAHCPPDRRHARLGDLVHLVYSVCLVYLGYSLSLIQSNNQTDQID